MTRLARRERTSPRRKTPVRAEMGRSPEEAAEPEILDDNVEQSEAFGGPGRFDQAHENVYTRRHSVKHFRRLLVLVLTSFVVLLRFKQRRNLGGIHLSFSTCGGASNQILSTAFVITYAITNQVDTLIAPAINMNGRQLGGVDLYPNLSDTEGFTRLFHWETAQRFLKRNGVTFTKHNNAPLNAKYLLCKRENSLGKCTQKLSRCHRCHVHMECPFIHRIWDVAFLKGNKELFNQALSSLVPSDNVRQLSLLLVKEFHYHKPANCTAFIHFRVENDWQKHCESWPPAQNDPLKCFVNVSTIMYELHGKNISNCALLLSYDADDIDEQTRRSIMVLKDDSKLRIFDGTDFLSKYVSAREFRAAINVAAAINNFDFFVGNSVSTMSALIIRQRRMKGLWAAQYNRGSIPLSEFVPGFSLPWVFTLRGSDVQYDEMMKVAVLSASQETSLQPYAMIHPSEEHYERVEWLRSMGVHVCIHKPVWEAGLVEILHNSTEGAKRSSHLYSDPKQVLGTYFRLDLPVLAELLQFEHVLYTDTDVLFRRDITTMQGDDLSLPSTIQLAIENPDIKVLNAGVYVASLPFLRATHQGLIDTLMASDSVSYGRYGPGDQGLLNKYYGETLRSSGLLSDVHYNAKSYDATSQAKIIHFHGPKPLDYEEAAARGTCERFPFLCARGLKNGYFCSIFNSWIDYCQRGNCTSYKALTTRCRS